MSTTAKSVSSRRYTHCCCKKSYAVALLSILLFIELLRPSRRESQSNGLLGLEVAHKKTEDLKPARNGYVRPNKIFGHVHMAKTGGTELNGLLASRFERVCGHKGYSFDYYQHNKRVRKQNKTSVSRNIGGDTLSRVSPTYNRGRVPVNVMQERGYEDCDYISHEVSYSIWRGYGSNSTPMELHVPCRDPIDHLLSMCNHRQKPFVCVDDRDKLMKQISEAAMELTRFGNPLLHYPHLSVKCFPAFPIQRYLEFMSDYLQERRVVIDYVHRDTNRPRNKTKECLLENQNLAATVREMMIETFPYYKFCDTCLGSESALYAV